MPVTRGECKTPGGKLLGVSLGWGDGRSAALDARQIAYVRPESARIDGDFFTTSDEAAIRALRMLEAAIVEALADPHADALESLQIHVLSAWQESGAHTAFVGVAPQAVVTAAARAYLAMAPGGPDKPEAAERLGLPEHPQSLGQPVSLQSGASQSGALQPEAQSPELLPPQSLHARWQESSWGVVVDAQPLTPQQHMDLDVQLAQQVADGRTAPLLRFWRWGGRAIVLGAYQSEQAQVNAQQAHDGGFQVVRRCTGGGTMVVEPANTITYSLYAPLEFVRGLDPLQAYALCDEWLVLALRSLGVHAFHEPVNDIASPAGKIGGGASRRFLASPGSGGGGCFLHHVTLAYDMDAAMMVRVLRISAEKLRGKHVASAAKRVDPLRHQLADAGNPMTHDETECALRQYALASLPGAYSVGAYNVGADGVGAYGVGAGRA